MDFSFEKIHSAYMLFYERCDSNQKDQVTDMSNAELNQELADWIWQDNIQFLHDKHIFDTTYFNFMWFICSNIPPSLPECKEVMLSNVKLDACSANKALMSFRFSDHCMSAMLMTMMMMTMMRDHTLLISEGLLRQFSSCWSKT